MFLGACLLAMWAGRFLLPHTYINTPYRISSYSLPSSCLPASHPRGGLLVHHHPENNPYQDQVLTDGVLETMRSDAGDIAKTTSPSSVP